ncbi:MAG: pyridoxamine 5'-phosphate oxidase family protein [Patescibacteria group bacterium]|jgi:uncharacterized protein YhbP (UPF0306 family)|nr:pyridoxamine 5'-phosphate oxidase family protein [Patescibacteria group bacterium]
MDSVKQILQNVRYATISTVDDSPLPWAAPVWYVFDNALNIYWWSPVESIHSQNILNNGNIYITIFDSTLPEGKGIGVYMKADATKLPAEETEDVIKIYNASTTIYKLNMNNCSGDAPTRLYKATPKQLWINDGETQNGFWVDIRKEIPFSKQIES